LPVSRRSTRYALIFGIIESHILKFHDFVHRIAILGEFGNSQADCQIEFSFLDQFGCLLKDTVTGVVSYRSMYL